MPLVDDDGLESREVVRKIFVSEKEGETLGGGDEAEGELFVEFCFLVRGGVAGANADFEFEIEFGDGF